MKPTMSIRYCQTARILHALRAAPAPLDEAAPAQRAGLDLVQAHRALVALRRLGFAVSRRKWTTDGARETA